MIDASENSLKIYSADSCTDDLSLLLPLRKRELQYYYLARLFWFHCDMQLKKIALNVLIFVLPRTRVLRRFVYLDDF